MTIDELLAEAAKIEGWRIIPIDNRHEVRCNVRGRLHCPITAVARIRGRYLDASNFDGGVAQNALGISQRNINLIVGAADFRGAPQRKKLLKALNLEEIK